MIRAYCLLAAAAMLFNGSTLAPFVEVYRQTTADHRPAPSSATAPTAFTAKADRDADGLFHVAGMVNRHPVRFVVDTGATVTVLSARDAAAMGLSANRLRHTGTLNTAGGLAAMQWERLDELEISGSHLTNVDVVVLQGGANQSLLGQDILAKLGTITITGGQLQIRPPTA